MNRSLGTILLLLAAACVEDESVPGGAQMLLPDDVLLHWDGSFNGADDGLVALVPVDVMVYESESGEPLEAVRVDLYTDAASTFMVPSEGVSAADVDDCLDCVLSWDAYRDRYLVVDERDLTPTPLRLETDEDGLARAYVWVDAFPSEADDGDQDMAPVAVHVTMGLDDEAFLLLPQ